MELKPEPLITIRLFGQSGSRRNPYRMGFSVQDEFGSLRYAADSGSPVQIRLSGNRIPAPLKLEAAAVTSLRPEKITVSFTGKPFSNRKDSQAPSWEKVQVYYALRNGLITRDEVYSYQGPPHAPRTHRPFRPGPNHRHREAPQDSDSTYTFRCVVEEQTGKLLEAGYLFYGSAADNLPPVRLRTR